MQSVAKMTHNSGSQTNPLPPSATKRVVVLDLEGFRRHLAQLAGAAGSNAETGRRLGVSGQFIDMVIDGKRKPGPKLCAAVGARRKLMFEIDVEAE